MSALIPFANAADTRGLPPARAALARLIASIRRERDDLGTLQAGRAKLAARIADAERAIAAERAADDAEAEGVLSTIRRGGEVALNFVRGRREPPLDLTVARLALAKADAAIAEREAVIGGLTERLSGAVAAVLHEEAQTQVADYDRALRTAAEAAAKLAALDAHQGRIRIDRLLVTSPGFVEIAGDVIDTRPTIIPKRAVAAAREVWAAFARALAQDPRADASRHLRFASLDSNADGHITYESLDPVSRRIEDLRRSREG